MPKPDDALKGTQLVASILERDIFQAVQTHQPRDEREWCLWGYFQRTLPIMRSLSFLVQPSFFQLTLAANRNLLEGLVDVVHLEHRSPADVAPRIEAWEASAKLKTAEAAVSYLERTKQQTSPLYPTFAGYIAREGDKVRQDRQHFWPPRGTHPERWTGRNLGDDCRSADKLEHLGLEDFYETQYRQMNWNIHGSGFAGIRGVDMSGFDMIYTYSQIKSAEFAFKTTTIVLQELGLLGTLQLQLEQVASKFGDVVRGGC